MVDKIKSRVEKTLKDYCRQLNRQYPLRKISPILDKAIRNFIQRPGKRLRSSLMILSHLGYGGKESAGLYRAAASLELLHNFLLIHDDIIDKAALRKGQPTVHTWLDRFLKGGPKARFSGSDLSIIVGDILGFLALNLFLSIKAKEKYKEKALVKFSQIVTYTGAGQFVEILCGIKSLRKLRLKDILRIYDLKSGHYSFSYPLVLGAALAGAKDTELKRLFKFGIQAGRAFQIKDDILDIFGSQEETGKSSFTDLKERKKTILIFYGWRNSKLKERKLIEKILAKESITWRDCLKIKEIMRSSGALDNARRDLRLYLARARKIGSSLSLSPAIKEQLLDYTGQILE